MEGELQRFIKVWITAISCLCYCYYIASRIPKGFLRLLSLFPILYIFLILPLNLSSIHLLGPTTFFLVWLATFKLLLFSFNQGPLSLSSSLNIFHFISIASLPIIPKHHPTSKDSKLTKNNTNPPHQLIRNIGNSKKQNVLPSHKKSSLLLFPKMLIAAMIICAYDYRENLHPHLILFFYCCHVYLGIELVLALCAAPARAMFGYEIEPQFNEPYLSTSLQDFWGRRWNLMVTNILRPTVYNPIRRISTYFVGHTFGNSTAMLATFLVSGLMHEVIYYYLARAPPTWEVTWFFVIHGVCTAAEVVAKKALLRRGWWLPRFVSVPFTLMFLVVTAQWLFFPQLLRNGVDRKAIAEYAIIVDLVKSKLPISIF